MDSLRDAVAMLRSGASPVLGRRGQVLRALVAAATVAASFAFSPPSALAAEPAPGRASKGGAEHEQGKMEFAALPVVGGDSDVGIGGGVITSLARVRPDLDPYLWRLEAVGMTTVKRVGEDYDVRYADVSLTLKLPHVIRDRLALTLRASYTEETDLSYYGMGNGVEVGGRGEDDPYYSFDWTHPAAEVNAELKLLGGFELVAGTSYTHAEIDAPADGKLAQDARSPNGELRYLTRIVPEHDVLTFSLGLNWDTRDDEVSPQQGYYHSLRFDFSPNMGERVPYRWLRTNLALRQYVPLWPGRLVAAVRVVGDALSGQPPFYELARFDSSFCHRRHARHARCSVARLLWHAQADRKLRAARPAVLARATRKAVRTRRGGVHGSRACLR